MKKERWIESDVPGYAFREWVSSVDHRFTVFRIKDGAWELFDARYRTIDEANARALKDAAKREP